MRVDIGYVTNRQPVRSFARIRDDAPGGGPGVYLWHFEMWHEGLLTAAAAEQTQEVALAAAAAHGGKYEQLCPQDSMLRNLF